MTRYLAILLITVSSLAASPDREIQAKHLKVVLKQSVEKGKATLIADVTLEPGMHVYAPEIEPPYLPIKLVITPADGVRVGKTIYPRSTKLHLAAIDETVPVYQDRFEIRQVVDLPAGRWTRELEVRGTLNYQTCDDKICYRPVSVPLRWTIPVSK